MKRLLVLLGVVLTVARIRGQVPLDEPPTPSSLHVQVVDVSGRSINAAEVVLTPAHSQKELSSRYREGDFTNVPPGEYRISVSASGFHSKEIAVRIDRPRVWATVALQVGSIGAAEPDPVLAGRLLPVPKVVGRLWAKLTGVYNSVSLESEINLGFFSFEPHEPGEYVLLIVNEERVLDMRRVVLSGYQALTFQVGRID